jgi:RpiR family carbohydrate utilization transcriptional regulator
MSVLNSIRDGYDGLRKSEQKVADIILADPSVLGRINMVSLAEQAGVSQPTVARLCKQVGCSGFTDLKLRMVQEVAAGVPFVPGHVDTKDDASQLTNKIFTTAASTLLSVRDSLDVTAVERAGVMLAAAPRIEFFGCGTSGVVAQDAYHRFCRLDIRCGFHQDSVMQSVASSTLGEKEVAVIVSYTGRTRSTVELAKVCHEVGGSVIGITAKSSPLAKYCDVVLDARITEDSEIYLPTSSRLAQLAIVDVLAASVFLKRRDREGHRLQAVKRAVRATRLGDAAIDEENGDLDVC